MFAQDRIVVDETLGGITAQTDYGRVVLRRIFFARRARGKVQSGPAHLVDYLTIAAADTGIPVRVIED